MGLNMTKEISLMATKRRVALNGEPYGTPFSILNLSHNMPFALTLISLCCKKFKSSSTLIHLECMHYELRIVCICINYELVRNLNI